MQVIILAAGSGTRFLPFSLSRPKPLFSVFGKTIIEHNLSELDGLVDEVIIIVGYKKEMIMEKIGKKFGKIEIKYIEDKEIVGTGSSARLAKNLLKNKFLLLNGDDFYSKKDIKNSIEHFPSILVREHESPSSFGVIIEENGILKSIVEKPKESVSNLVNTGLYCLPKEIFDFEVEKSSRGEYEFTDYIKNFINDNELNVCKASYWIPASYPWEIFNAFPYLFSKEKQEKNFEVEKGAIIKEEVIIKNGTVIKSGSYIEGKVWIGQNCSIGPNCFIREGSVIEDNCRIGHSVEIKNSMIGKGTNINHLSYVGDSIIGENCNLGAGTITANLRHDKSFIKIKIKETLVDTKRIKLGVMIGDNVKTGIGTLIYPGKRIYPDKITLPGEKIKEDII
jgi:bifunctional UDP-N-acetylglucosamine pyrophosphorylase/glucosamine-1-phosphate N-acetyltransferase